MGPPDPAAEGRGLIGLITDFVGELRDVGVPVSMVETIDAVEALEVIDLADRPGLKATLAATMVKNSRHDRAFDAAFEAFFAGTPIGSPAAEPSPSSPGDRGAEAGGGGAGGGDFDLDALIDALFQALSGDDMAALRAAAAQAVSELAGMEPGRPVGGTYYLYRTLRRLDIDSLRDRLLEAALGEVDPDDELERRLVTEEVEQAVHALEDEIRAEIRRRLVEDRGRKAVAKSTRTGVVEEIDLMHATRDDLRQIESVIEPLARKLTARLARRRRLGRTGRLDFRRTMRESLASGGVPLEPVFKRPRPRRPAIFLICDISGSMATFARFTLQFSYAMSAQFSKLRSFVFVDAVDEVTDFFTPGTDFGTALARIGTEADVVWMDGHSDYGHALTQFEERYGAELDARATIIIAGDARNNYREPRDEVLARMSDRVHDVFWLNPEPRAYWDSGDSVMSRYARWCDGAYEVRNLVQLEAFVERVAASAAHRRVRIPSTSTGMLPTRHL